MKQLIEEYGIDSFTTEIVFRDNDYAVCFWEEQRLIMENKDNPLRLNKAYVNPQTGQKVLTTYNETPDEKAARIAKMQKAKKGKFNSNGHFGLKHSEATKQKMKDSQAKLSYTHSEETKQKMRSQTRSSEHAKRLGEALKGKPWSAARRQAYLDKKDKGN